jgi:hypothetical protein
MVEAVSHDNECLEFEVRGGLWEGFHAVLFYGAIVCALLATLGVARVATGAACVFLIFYPIFAIFSSPTYVVIDPSRREVTVERYHYFIPSRRVLKHDELERIEVAEPSRVPSGKGEKDSKRDLSYYVRVYLVTREGRRFKIFRSGMTGAPSENREKAFLVTQSASSNLDLPVVYTGGGEKRGREKV